jgi:tRNA-splicing ligase RtcB
MEHPKLRLTIPWTSLDLPSQQQIAKVLAMPELELLAVMPDAHSGYDLCIGGVALTRGIISPSFVGYDIGCGMCHVNTGQTARELGIERTGDRERLFRRLTGDVPAGAGQRGDAGGGRIFKPASGDKAFEDKVRPFAGSDLGSLGSGNHFLEIGENPKGEIGVSVHTGSRRAGYEIASWHMARGRLLALDGDDGRAYLADMLWAQDFALENRRLIMRAALAAMGLGDPGIADLEAAMINENHNHAELKGGDLVLHRKGATPAESGQLGVIASNQRDGVWITRGLGNAEFLASASHGAGRAMSRRAALKKGRTSDLEKVMRGIVCRTDKEVLDEAPWAYKRIEAVLAAQDGVLVDVLDHFKPLVVLKG